jgi:signal transduction histidine kinase/CheY-like chemotaxis protein
MPDLVVLVAEILFGLLFAWAVVVAVQRRDAIARDVALVFAPLAVLFVTQVARQVLGPLPSAVTLGATILLLAQPVFSLKLVADIRAIPAWLVPTAIVAFTISTAVILVTGTPLSIAVALGAIGVFVVTELVAAAYLALEAGRRHGSVRFRLALAAVATAAVAGALLTSGASAAGDSVAAAATVVIRFVALFAALAYWIAFLPPLPLRRFWQRSAAFTHSEALLTAPASAEPAELWAQLARTVRYLTGAATVVLTTRPDGSLKTVATDGPTGDTPRSFGPGSLDPLTSGDGHDPVSDALTEASGIRFAEVVPLLAEGIPAAVVVLLRGHPSLFDSDDAGLVSSLGVRSLYLVQRREILAEQERLGGRLAETVEALRAASAAKSDFLASMSHELRTPLNAIIGFSELMISEPEVDGTLAVPREWVEHIRSGGSHLLVLINDVLDLSKIEAGRLDLVRERIHLPHAIGESVAGLRPLADRKQLAIELVVEPAIVDVDPGRFRQILYNLLSNAIKFTPAGGSISIEASTVGDEVRIAVRDSGVGISTDDQARVFEEFRQVGGRAEQAAGSGLGLALTKRLTEAHGGRVELESTVGAGSTFTVVLPRLDVRHAESAPPPMLTSPRVTDDAPEILVIEDEPSSARLLHTYLADGGYRVRLAHDGETGLELARERRPSAVVLDVLLPGMDGWEVLRRIKSDDALRDIPVIIVTVVDERGIGLALGAVDYLVKPIDREGLLACLDRFTFTTKVKTRPISVLAIDDEPAALDLIQGSLQPLGFGIRRAASALEGLALARTSPPDLVICDLLMPEIDGFEVVSQLHDDPATSGVPILILTAHTLSAAEKDRLNGRILGIAQKGDITGDGLRQWLARIIPPEPEAVVAE